MKKIFTLFLLISISTILAQNEFIPFHSQEVMHHGTAGWNANGSGPEPQKTGHQLTWLPISAVAYYYIASREYGGIDPDTNAAALAGTGTITGFPSFVAALTNNNFNVADITMKYTYQTLGNDAQGVDWTYTSATTTETRIYTGGTFVIYLKKQPMVGGSCPNMNMTIVYNDLANFTDDLIGGVSEFVIPNNLSGSSSAAVQACAAAFLTDVGNYGIRYNFTSLQPAVQTNFQGNGRTGAFFISQGGKFEKGTTIIPVELSAFTANIKNNSVQLNWQTSTETNNKGFEVEKYFSNQWTKVGFVEGNGSTTLQHTYSFIDDFSNISYSGMLMYRLKQIDFDGSFEYSNEVSVGVKFNPNIYKLMQNYPNPFNPSTKIKYAVSNRLSKQYVLLKVYDILGNEVATLVNEEKEQGVYEVEFTAKDGITSGIYYYQLQTGDFIATKKMLMLK